MEELKQRLATETDPRKRLELLKEFAHAAMAAGQPEQALKALGAAVRQAPTDLEVVSGLRAAFLATGQYQTAADWLKHEIALVSEPVARAHLLKELGSLYQNHLNDFEQAQQAFARARQLSPDVFNTAPGVSPEAPPVVTAEVAAPTAASPALAAAPETVGGSSGSEKARPDGTPRRGLHIALGLASAVVAAAAFVVTQPGVVSQPPGEPTPSQGPEAAGVSCSGTLERREEPAPDGVVIEVFDCSVGNTSTTWKKRDGRVVEMVEYLNGVRTGATMESPSPDVRIEGSYALGERTGTWKTFERGVLVAEESWLGGKRSGLARSFSTDGGVTATTTWVQGRRQGRSTVYSLMTGKLIEEGYWSDDGPIGRWSRWDARGVLIESWREPLAADAGVDDAPIQLTVAADQLFGGQTLGWWRVRYSEAAALARKDPQHAELPALVRLRAERAGLRFNEQTLQLEVLQ